jgi:hypothetical protein
MQSTTSGVKTRTDGDTANTDPDPPATCPRCGSPDIVTTPCTSGPHFARARCNECRRVWFLKAPWTLARASRFTMPRGKHAGRQLGALIETEVGRSYVRWLAANIKGNVGIAARIMLEHVEVKRMSK